MKFFRLIFPCAAIMLFVLPMAAQSQDPQEKQMMEYIDNEVKRLSNVLGLEYWQEFYVDSTLTHDYRAMGEELKSLQTAKVENSDLYLTVRDKWMEQIDASYKRIFNEAQWKKYWKTTGQRAQKERDKRKK